MSDTKPLPDELESALTAWLEPKRSAIERELRIANDVTKRIESRYCALQEVAAYLEWTGEYLAVGLTQPQLTRMLVRLYAELVEAHPASVDLARRSAVTVVSDLLCDPKTQFPQRRPPSDSVFRSPPS